MPIDPSMKRTRIKAALRAQIEDSPLRIITHDIYMYFQKPDLVDEPGNPVWANQAIYFWQLDEPFEKMALPIEFQSIPKHYFIFHEVPEGYKMYAGTVMPWFGHPGGGKKHSILYDDKEVQIKDLLKRRVIRSLEFVNLTMDNAQLLQLPDQYYFWMNDNELLFNGGRFTHRGEPITFIEAMEIGLVRVVRVYK